MGSNAKGILLHLCQVPDSRHAMRALVTVKSQAVGVTPRGREGSVPLWHVMVLKRSSHVGHKNRGRA